MLARAGQLNNLFNYLAMREMNTASLIISEDAVTSIRNLENVKSDMDDLLKITHMRCCNRKNNSS